MVLYLRCALFLVTLSYSGLAIGQDIFKVVNNHSSERSRQFATRSLHYTIDLKKLREKSVLPSDELELVIPTFNGNKTIQLERFQLLSGTYELETQEGSHQSQAQTFKFYKGRVEGAERSFVGMSMTGDEVHLMIHDQDGSFEVKRLKNTDELYSGIYSKDIIEPEFIPCLTDTGMDYGIKAEKKDQISRSGSLDCVEIYLEVDYKAFTENGSTVESVEEWVMALMAQVAVFFNDADIPITVSGIKVYTTNESDPYKAHGSSSSILPVFRDSMVNQGFNGRLAHLLSGRGIGGGIAYLNVLCSNYSNVGVSGNLNSGGTSYGTYTWNINVVAHELGHNFGSNHTHDCVWNGNNTQIDDCGNVWLDNNGHSPGYCYDSDNKIMPGNNNATIMSYCHVVGGSSINLNLGFHPQVRDRIYSRYSSTNCGGNEACVDVPPSNNLCSDATRLEPTIACIGIVADNIYATASGALPGISCEGTNGENDVWFVVNIPEDGQLFIETGDENGGLGDMVMQVYSGSCESLTAIECDDNSGQGNHAQIHINDIDLADQDVFVRVVSKSDTEGEFSICAYSPNLPCNETALALIDFYNLMGGSSWTNKQGWSDGAIGSDCNYCQWYGVTCNEFEKVTSLNLYNNNLSGNLDNTLLNLSELESISLGSNSIGGNIPPDFVNPVNVKYISLSSNNLQGSVPTELIQAPLLEGFVANNNNLSGDLPEISYSSKITYLDLANNNFSGCFPSAYTRFLNTGEVSMYANTGLPFNGNFYGRPSDYAGFDFDNDSHCYEVSDCVDFNNTIFNGAPELCDGEDNDCDGEVDEGVDRGPNIWLGPDSGGSWTDSVNWSLGHLPLACEDVEVGMNGETISISSIGQSQSFSQELRSLCLGPNVTLNAGGRFYLTIKHGYLMNMGSFSIDAYTTFSPVAKNRNGIENSGQLTIAENVYVAINKSGHNAIFNKPGGTIINNGTLVIDSVDPITGLTGIKNESIIHNNGQIEIRGDFPGPQLELKTGSQLISEGSLLVGGESFGEGEN